MSTTYVVIEENNIQFYLLKIQRRGYDVYCFPPDLGAHVSLHESGQSNITYDSSNSEPAPMTLMQDEAGISKGRGIEAESIKDIGRSTCICVALIDVGSLATEYREFNRTTRNSFVIDKETALGDSAWLEIGVWAVPARNEISFTFNNPQVLDHQIYKLQDVEPQLWIYAKPADA